MRKPLLPAFILLLGLAATAASRFDLGSTPTRNAPVAASHTAAIVAITPPPLLSAVSALPDLTAPSLLPPSFKREASALDRVTSNPAASEKRLQALAAALNAAAAQALAGVALSSSYSHNERFLAAYLLSLRATDFRGNLEAIAAADHELFHHHHHPHTSAELNYHFETSVRVAALAALDRVPDREHAAAFFRKVEASHSNETIRKVARVGRVGALRNEALVDSYLTAKAEGALNDATHD
jgi:hypothetical protein